MRFLLLFTLLFIPLSGQLGEFLTDEERNLRCCAQKAPCCKVYPTDFEIKALLVKCHKPDKSTEKKKMPMTVVRTVRAANQEEGCMKKRMEQIIGITNCKRKLKLTVKIKNNGITNCKSQYLLIDHVFDSVTQQKQKLFNPYVLKIVQQPVLAVYGLFYDGIVNAQAKEMVVNKDQAGYTGCNPDSNSNPVCGSVSYRSDTIPYSNGFCCSCNRNREQNNFFNISEVPYTYKFPQISHNDWQNSNDLYKNEFDENGKYFIAENYKK
ncbi:unnamed protein product [Psylliodes chrysocephalus]|uniref:Generative cell specific-1/HAP2 domain-containing protein n=1 Tax=Psylliodes chrysocephalus TaxID=3402493 RepID=A0A9P0GIB2_9CUCU|nr:unnamed protein product [Psylliodes chrysocephala]